LSADTVARAFEEPVNLKNGHSTPYRLADNADTLSVCIASNEFITTSGEFYPLVVDGQPLLAIAVDDGHAYLYARFYDEYNRPALMIERNELIYTTDRWDISFVGSTLTIRSQPRRLFLELRFMLPSVFDILRGRVLCNGVEFLIYNETMTITKVNATVSNSTMRAKYGVVVGDHPPDGQPAGIHWPDENRYG
jgi:hypothetical protein